MQALEKQNQNQMHSSLDHRNFLGQTSLHLAAAERGSLVLPLLEAGHAVDAKDIHGITPLMYTAGLGKIEAAKSLIAFGADLLLEDKLRQRNFLQFALARNQYDYALDVAHYVEALYPDQSRSIGIYFGRSILLALVANPLRATLPSCTSLYLKRLINMVDDINFTFDDLMQGTKSNHLLHYEWMMEQVQVLVTHGFTSINQKRDDGATALMLAAHSGSLALVKYYVEIGANVNDRDTLGRNALSYAISAWSEYHAVFDEEDDRSYRRVMGFLISAGVDTDANDACVCPCSPGGCSPFSYLPSHFAENRTIVGLENPFYTIEWLAILEDLGCEEVAKDTVRELLRRAKFYELQMNHDCCRSTRIEQPLWFEFPHRMSSRPEESNIVDVDLESQEELEAASLALSALGFSDLRRQWLQQLYELYSMHLTRNNLPGWSSILEGLQQPKAAPNIVSL